MPPQPLQTVEKQYPVLYWTAVAYIVGLPNFLHFDPTGRGGGDTLNFQSIFSVAQSVVTGYLLVLLLFLDHRRRLAPRPGVPVWMWLLLLAQYVFSSIMQPQFRITAHQNTDLLLSLFFLGQWVVGFCLLYVLYSRAMFFDATAAMVRLLGRVAWIWIGMVWLFLPIIPSQVYGDTEDASNGIHQLGGEFIHPSKLATLAGMAFFYALLYVPRGFKRWVALGISLVTLALTHARTSQAGFVLTFGLFLLVFSRKAILRWGAAFLLVLAPVLAIAFRSTVLRYVARGQSMQTLSSLDDRSRIWKASWDAIRVRPGLGYGYIVGAKKALRDVWTFTHWIPPHSHNEFIGAALNGGVVAFALTALIYVFVAWRVFPTAKRHPQTLFLFMVFLQLLVATISGPILSYRYQTLGGVMLLCSIAALSARSAGRYRTELLRKRAPARSHPAQLATT